MRVFVIAFFVLVLAALYYCQEFPILNLARQRPPMRQLAFERQQELERKRSEGGNQQGFLPLGDLAVALGGGLEVIGEYIVEIEIGTPPEVFRVQVDTGSSNLLIPALGCTDSDKQPCAHADSFYSATASKTAHYASCEQHNCFKCVNAKCEIGVEYADGSAVLAYVLTDVLRFPGNYSSFTSPGSKNTSAIDIAVPINLGAIFTESVGFSSTSVDGIIGMAYQSIAEGNLPTVFDSLVGNGLGDVFAMCLNDYGGVMTLGGIHEDLYTGDIHWTPLIEETYYVVETLDFLVENNSIFPSTPKDGYETIIDSGTTLMYMPPELRANLQKQMIAQSCTGNDTTDPPGLCDKSQNIFTPNVCVHFSSKDLALYPTLYFNFPLNTTSQPSNESIPSNFTIVNSTTEHTSFLVPFTPDKYFISVLDYRGQPCYSFAIMAMNASQILVGDLFMREYYTIFDRQNKRLGFAAVNENNCDLSLPLTNGSFYSTTSTTKSSSTTSGHTTHGNSTTPGGSGDGDKVSPIVLILLLSAGFGIVLVLGIIGLVACVRSQRQQDYSLVPSY